MVVQQINSQSKDSKLSVSEFFHW